MDATNCKINILSQSVVNKIAAGEVIERPACVVKELVENAIDAEATRIDVHLEDSGKKLIRVIDDGMGMSPEDLSRAVLSHSTSKLHVIEDIYAITTLGFRGEAIPSIGAISRVKIVSRTRDGLAGAEIEVSGGDIGKVKERGCPVGTQVEVRDIFFNTPVRRKFLKMNPTEMAYISEVITRMSLVNPRIHFNLVHNGRTVFNLSGASDIEERIVAFFGDEIGRNLISFRSQWPNLVLIGHILPPSYDCGSTKMQYVFINGRYIRNKTIFHAISEAYRGLLVQKRSPIVFLFLQMDPHEIDVNVHPTKIEIRFKDANQVYNQLLSCMRDNLMKSDLVTTPGFDKRCGAPSMDKGSMRREKMEGLREALANPFKVRLGGDRADSHVEANRNREAPCQLPLVNGGHSPGGVILGQNNKCVQIRASYIVEERPDGINIIDQHALHEIILYEEIKQDMERANLVSQQLLIPELVELTPADLFIVLNLREGLERLGFVIEEFGKNTVVVRAVPQILRNIDCKGFIKDLLDEVDESICKEDMAQRLGSLAKIMACKSSVKMGQRLTPQEIQALLEKRDSLPFTSNCPHGRPTAIFLSFEELDKQFKRR